MVDARDLSDDAIRVWHYCLLSPRVPFTSDPNLKFTTRAQKAMDELVSQGYAKPIDEDGSVLGVRQYNPTSKSLIPEMRRRGMQLHMMKSNDRIQVFEQARR